MVKLGVEWVHPFLCEITSCPTLNLQLAYSLIYIQDPFATKVIGALI
jgi:hypothetical protein